MRTSFINQLVQEAEQDDRIFLLVGDLGYNVVEPFAREFPNRYRNVGIAEQNMAGVAAGLAMTGFNVYFYSIGNFPTLRCIEQVRNDIAYHHANVKVVAVGGGYAYGDLGATHHATEALGIMRAIPNMMVCSPSDPLEAKAITTMSVHYNGPMYIQLGKAGEKVLHNEIPILQAGDIVPYKVDDRLHCIIVTGSIASVIVASEDAKEKDIYTLPFIKPVNKEQLAKIATKYESITVIEEHQLSCGAGSAVVEQLNDLYAEGEIAKYPKVYRIAIHDFFQDVSGSQQYLREKANLVNTKHPL